MQLSVVVPLYNEEENVEPLYKAFVASLQQLSIDYGIIFVDDGSIDNTCSNATGLAGSDRKLRLVKLHRNYGQTAALACSTDLTAGQIIVTLVGDLQYDPSRIANWLIG